MSKRAFRKRPAAPPRYPTVEQFDADRRTFLGQLGATLLGALVAVDMADPLGNNGRKRPDAPAKKKKKGGKKKKKKKHAQKKKPIKQPRVFLGLSTGNVARIDDE